MKNNKYSFTDWLNTLSDILTIIVSLIALYGTIASWQNGLFKKIKEITESIHHECVIEKTNIINNK